jgi:hypothetical protein
MLHVCQTALQGRDEAFVVYDLALQHFLSHGLLLQHEFFLPTDCPRLTASFM